MVFFAVFGTHRIMRKRFEQPPADIIAVSISGDKPYDRDRFYKTLEELKDNLLRLKGNIDFGNGAAIH